MRVFLIYLDDDSIELSEQDKWKCEVSEYKLVELIGYDKGTLVKNNNTDNSPSLINNDFLCLLKCVDTVLYNYNIDEFKIKRMERINFNIFIKIYFYCT